MDFLQLLVVTSLPSVKIVRLVVRVLFLALVVLLKVVHLVVQFVQVERVVRWVAAPFGPGPRVAAPVGPGPRAAAARPAGWSWSVPAAPRCRCAPTSCGCWGVSENIGH